MAYQALFKIEKPYFMIEDVAQALGINAASTEHDFFPKLLYS